jgi:succinoglycan biosynthesis transport protein ExoP
VGPEIIGDGWMMYRVGIREANRKARSMLPPRATVAQAPPPPPERLRPQIRPASPPPQPAKVLDLWLVTRWMWAGRVWIIACLTVGIIGALFASAVIPPRYTVHTDILLNPAQIQLPSDTLYGVTANAQRDAQLLEVGSRARLLTSTNVLTRVVDALSLDQDPEFATGAGSAEDARIVAIRSLYDRVGARRDAQSYMVTLSVWSNDPLKSVSISEAMVAGFRQEIVAAESDNSMRAADALSARLDTLRSRAGEAEANVEAFRRDNQLQGAGGQLLSSQSLTQLNAQVNEARAALIAAEARHAEMQALQQSPTVGAMSIESPVLTELRTQYADLRREATAQSAIFGPRHPNVTTLDPQIQSLEREIRQEAGRLAETARREVDSAQSVLDQLLRQLSDVRSVASQDNEAQVRLRELEREAEVQTAIYEAYLQRTAEIVEGGQVDATNIRVISQPVPPESRNWPPRTLVLLAMGGLAGLAVGVGGVLLFGLARFYTPLLRQRFEPAQGR